MQTVLKNSNTKKDQFTDYAIKQLRFVLSIREDDGAAFFVYPNGQERQVSNKLAIEYIRVFVLIDQKKYVEIKDLSELRNIAYMKLKA